MHFGRREHGGRRENTRCRRWHGYDQGSYFAPRFGNSFAPFILGPATSLLLELSMTVYRVPVKHLAGLFDPMWAAKRAKC